MESELIKDLNITEIIDWYNNKNVNPRTKRKITEKGKIYDFLKNILQEISHLPLLEVKALVISQTP